MLHLPLLIISYSSKISLPNCVIFKLSNRYASSGDVTPIPPTGVYLPLPPNIFGAIYACIWFTIPAFNAL